ncbi:MAG: hypothetical protein WKF63_10230, partial [Thermomicrobiales bacterium]
MKRSGTIALEGEAGAWGGGTPAHIRRMRYRFVSHWDVSLALSGLSRLMCLTAPPPSYGCGSEAMLAPPVLPP